MIMMSRCANIVQCHVYMNNIVQCHVYMNNIVQCHVYMNNIVQCHVYMNNTNDEGVAFICKDGRGELVE